MLDKVLNSFFSCLVQSPAPTSFTLATLPNPLTWTMATYRLSRLTKTEGVKVTPEVVVSRRRRAGGQRRRVQCPVGLLASRWLRGQPISSVGLLATASRWLRGQPISSVGLLAIASRWLRAQPISSVGLLAIAS